MERKAGHFLRCPGWYKHQPHEAGCGVGLAGITTESAGQVILAIYYRNELEQVCGGRENCLNKEEGVVVSRGSDCQSCDQRCSRAYRMFNAGQFQRNQASDSLPGSHDSQKRGKKMKVFEVF